MLDQPQKSGSRIKIFAACTGAAGRGGMAGCGKPDRRFRPAMVAISGLRRLPPLERTMIANRSEKFYCGPWQAAVTVPGSQ